MKDENKIEILGRIDALGYMYYEETNDQFGDCIGYDMLKVGDTPLCALKFNYNEKIYITYYISDVELTKDKFIENYVHTLYGNPKTDYSHVYGSAYTGYMWTDQEFRVGDHDLYRELANHDGKYCYLVIYSNIVEYRNDQIDDVLR